ncbi:MAG: serine/threonine-protein kinase [Sandaracinaceae bacterium]
MAAERVGDGDPFIGAVLNERYEIRAKLGAGGMGTVYEARHRLIDKRVVVKVLHRDFVEDDTAVERFRREAKAATAIDHDHVVDVTDFGSLADGTPFLVMEHLEGQPLSELIDDEGVLSVGRAAAIARQICDGLHAAHQKGIVHRDMKPENVFMVRRPRGGDFVKILDFGISRVLTESEHARLTQAGTAMGTPAFMAPEQAQGRPSTDHKADIFSVGVMLYEMLGGELPFAGDTLAALLLAVMTVTPRSVRELRADVPPRLAALVDRAMAKEPRDRPTAAELHDALEPFLELTGEPIRLRPDGAEHAERRRAETISEHPVVTEPAGALDPGENAATIPTVAALPAREIPETRAAEVVVDEAPGEADESSDESTVEPTVEHAAAPDSPIAAPPGASSSSLGRVAIAVGVVALVVTAGLAVALRSPSETAPPTAPAAPPAPTVAEVRVRIRASPATATIVLDGVELPNPTDAARPRSLDPVRLVVSADGYRTLDRMVVLDQDRSYDFELAEASGPSPPPEVVEAPAPGPGRRSTRRPPAQESEATPPTAPERPDDGVYRGRSGELRDDF